MNVLSLFDGMSCGQIALNRAGIKYDNYFASEIDKHAIKVTMSNYPNTIQLGDVTQIRSENLPKIDLLIGGSPCQSFSFSGKRLGMVTDSGEEVTTLERYIELKNSDFKFSGYSYIFWEYVRLLNDIKPKYFFLENVKMHSKWQNVITKAVGVEPIMINSDLVSAQNRKRLYWTNIPNVVQPEDKKLYIKDVLEEVKDPKYNITERYYKKKIGTLAYTKSRSNIRTINQKSKTLTTSGHCIANSGSTNIFLSDNEIRIPSPLECERLQTVPDNYTECVSSCQRYKMLGNGWTVDVIAHIFSFIKNVQQAII
jgi:DNA (cytosine-5)-methyltransferase 3A